MMIDDATIKAVRAAHAQGGDLAAAVELRERFPGLASNAVAMGCLPSILAMKPGMAEVLAARVAAARQAAKATRARGLVIQWE